MIVTFYSYKGGVGRSLALANIACLMAEDEEHPQRVLVWDFDVEAPGLQNLFPPKQPQRFGFIDLAYEFASSGKMPDVNDYIYESGVDGVWVLPAGTVGEEYCRKLQEIDWMRFFGSDEKEPGMFFDEIINGLKKREEPFDYILVDSRTGLNDQAGICTEVLSDLLVVLFRLTGQDLDGLEHVVPAIRSQLKRREKKGVEILPVASQVISAGSGRQSKHRKRAAKIFGSKLTYVRFDYDLVGEEKLFCLRDQRAVLWPSPPIIDDYENICSEIRKNNEDDTKTQAVNLGRLLRENDPATAMELNLKLLERRPRLARAWNWLGGLAGGMSESQRKNVKKLVAKIGSEDKANFFAHRWNASFSVLEATSPESRSLKEAKEALVRALDSAPEIEKGSIYREMSSIDSCRGDIESAVKYLREARKLSPDNNQIGLDLAMLYMRMGQQYFATACEVLDTVSDEVREYKFSFLAHLWGFLGEREKASEAYKLCNEYMGSLLKAHMFLTEGAIKKATSLVPSEFSDPTDVANWAEFYICAGNFNKALSLVQESAFHEQVKEIEQMAKFFKSRKNDLTEEKKKLLLGWNERHWDFRELLIFRERSIKEKKSYVKKLGLIEELIGQQQLENIKSSGFGLFNRRRTFRTISDSSRGFRVVIKQ